MAEDKFAKFRKKPTRKARESYRPTTFDASVGEAKEILKARYKKRYGLKVTRITRRDYHFMVYFGEDKNGKGKGPNGLRAVMCNWPYINDLRTIEEARQWLINQGVIKPPKKKKRKARKRRKK